MISPLAAKFHAPLKDLKTGTRVRVSPTINRHYCDVGSSVSEKRVDWLRPKVDWLLAGSLE